MAISKDSAETLQTANDALWLSKNTDKIEVICLKKNTVFECSIDENIAILKNDITGDAYLDLFVCESNDPSAGICHYADVLVHIN